MKPVWGPQYLTKGYFPKIGNDGDLHSFGGDAWKALGNIPTGDEPALILDLDMRDPRVSRFVDSRFGLSHLPLCSHLNSSLWWGRQNYRIDEETRVLKWEAGSGEYEYETCDEGARIVTPLPFHRICLEEMSNDDIPSTEERYWRIGDTFGGGGKFIRLFGAPYWLQDAEEVRCECGLAMEYVASIGYERYSERGRFTDRAFFIGESALYFFCCFGCRRVSVIPQST